MTYARGNVMDATLRAPFCHCGNRVAGNRAIAAAAASASPTSPNAFGVAAPAAAVTAITVQSLLAVAQRERGSF